jgi:hypothetical protein
MKINTKKNKKIFGEPLKETSQFIIEGIKYMDKCK